MRYLLNILTALPMIIKSHKLGQNMKNVIIILKFLSSDKSRSITIENAELDSNDALNDIKKYINKYGSGISIIRDTKIYDTKAGRMRYTKLKLYKNISYRDTLYMALKPYLKEEKPNSKITNIEEYKSRIKVACM